MSKIKISVVICTYNRAELLRIAIQSVLDQDYPHENYELIVVDNASSDNTRYVVEEFSIKYPNVLYYFEPQVGLSRARNRGWLESEGEYIAYLDDDASAMPGWLRTAVQVITEIHPAILGGPVLPLYDVEKPVWYKDSYSANIKRDTPGPLEEFISGGNSFNRKTILEALAGYKPEFGMVGNEIGYAEETELQIRLRERFPDEITYYHPDIAIRHLVPAYKMRLSWRIRSRYTNASAFTRAKFRKRPHSFDAGKKTLLCLVWLLFDLVNIVARDRQQYPYWQNYIYEKIGSDVSHLAIASTHLCIGLNWHSDKTQL